MFFEVGHQNSQITCKKISVYVLLICLLSKLPCFLLILHILHTHTQAHTYIHTYTHKHAHARKHRGIQTVRDRKKSIDVLIVPKDVYILHIYIYNGVHWVSSLRRKHRALFFPYSPTFLNLQTIYPTPLSGKSPI